MKINRYARLFYPLLCFMILFSCQITNAQDDKWLRTTFVSLDADNKPMGTILSDLESQCSCTLNVLTDLKKKYTIHMHHQPMIYVLKEFFEKKGFLWKSAGRVVSIWKPVPILPVRDTANRATRDRAAMERKIFRGSVVDAHGEPLPAATVTVKGRKRGTFTDHSGRFALSAEDSVTTLVFSFIGFKTIEKQCTAAKTAKVRLVEADSSLDETAVSERLPASRWLTTAGVSTISAADIAHYPAGDFAAVLQGRATGLAVTASNGVPGASYRLMIRGRNSLFNRPDPLILVNKVPFAANNQNLNQFPSMVAQNTGGGVGSIGSINPADIESMEVLKDAAATAIYGSRGANGVINIKTKTGSVSGFNVIANITKGFSTPTFKYKMLTTPQYIALRREGYRNDGLVPNNIPGSEGYAPDIIDTTSSTDWQHMLVGNTAAITDAYLSISMGSARTQARLGIGYLDETTPFSADMGRKLWSGHSSIQYGAAGDPFRLSGSFYLSAADNRSYNGTLLPMYLRPNGPSVYNPDHTLNWADGMEWFQNPEADRRKAYKIYTDNVIFSLAPQYSISKRLVLKANLGYSGLFVRENLRVPIVAQNPATADVLNGTSSFGANRLESFIIEPMLEYSAEHLKLIAGASFQYSRNNALSYVGRGYTNDAVLGSIDAASYFTDTIRGGSEYKYGSVFWQANYNVSNKYIMNLTYRMDGSSRFSPEKRLGHFGAVGAAWIFSEESFMNPLRSILEYGKLRASYGVTGNDQIGDYQYLDTWRPTRGELFQGLQGFTPESLYNPEYSWERCRKADIALDLQLKGDWSLNVNYFLNRSDQQIVQFSLPAQTGFNSVLKNFDAVIENRGWEIAVDGNLFKTSSLQIGTSINLSVPENRLVRFDHLLRTAYASYLLIDKPVSALNLFQYDGVDPKTGVSRLKDLDDDGNITDKDRRYAGHLDPVFFGGASLTVNWKNWELSVFGEFRKQTVPSYTYNAIMGDLLMGMPSNHLALVNDHWRNPGDIAQYSRASTRRTSDAHANRNLVAASDRAYRDGSYFKLRNVSVAYTFHGAGLSRGGIENIRVAVKARNLFTFTGYDAGDPETANLFVLPTMKTVALSARITFKDFLKPKKK